MEIQNLETLSFALAPPPPRPCKYQWPTPSPLINTNWPSLQHGCDLGGHYMKSCMKYTYRTSKFTLICDHIDEILIFVSDKVLAKMPQKSCYNYQWKKNTHILRKMGQIPKLKYRKAHKSSFMWEIWNGQWPIQVTRRLDKIRRVDISLFVDFLAF